jgi:hypothetical protein
MHDGQEGIHSVPGSPNKKSCFTPGPARPAAAVVAASGARSSATTRPPPVPADASSSPPMAGCPACPRRGDDDDRPSPDALCAHGLRDLGIARPRPHPHVRPRVTSESSRGAPHVQPPPVQVAARPRRWLRSTDAKPFLGVFR